MPKEIKDDYRGRTSDELKNAGDTFLLDEGNNEAALVAYRTAANLGHVDAMNSMSSCYAEKGDGDSAILWLKRAAAFGHKQSIKLLKEDYDPGWCDQFVDRVRAGLFGDEEDTEDMAVPSLAEVEFVLTADVGGGHGVAPDPDSTV